MSEFITSAFVDQFRSNVIHLSQQKGSKLRPYVREDSVTGKSHIFERMGPVAARKRTSRHSDTPLIQTPHDRRKVFMEDWDWADLVDDEDKARLLISPESEYAINGRNAMGRAIDDLIIAAATGNAYDATDTSIPLPAGQKVAVNYVESGSAANSNLTIGKLRRIQDIFGTQDVDEDAPRVLVISQSQLSALLRTTEVTNADYNTVRALVDGKVDSFMGLKFVRTQRLEKSGNNRVCFAFVAGQAEGGIGLSVGRDLKVDIGPRRDKNMAIQVFMSLSMGSARIEDEKVVQVLCDETA